MYQTPTESPHKKRNMKIAVVVIAVLIIASISIIYFQIRYPESPQALTPTSTSTSTPTTNQTQTPTPTLCPTFTPASTIKPASGLFADGFENSFESWTGTNLNLGWVDDSGNLQPAPITQSNIVHNGSFALECPSQYHSQCVYKTISAPLSTVYLQSWVYFSKLPSSGNIVTFMTAIDNPNGINVINALIYNDNGTVKWAMDNPPFYPDTPNHAVPVRAQIGPVANQWYCVQLQCSRTGSDVIANLLVNGQNVISNYNYHGSTDNFGTFLLGGYDRNVPNEFDGIAVYLDDTQIAGSPIT